MVYKRVHIFYSGQVQGVGFRYTARSIASELGLLGFVRNLRDGRVEVVCEGQEKKIKQFLDRVKSEFPDSYLMEAEINWEEPKREFCGFNIIF